MTQLILDTSGVNLTLPESIKGGYTCENHMECKDLPMASGRIAREIIGWRYLISYQYGYLTDEERNAFITACETGWRREIQCAFLPVGGSGLITSRFLVKDFTFPKYMWSTKIGGETVPLYGDYRLSLQEVTPHA